MCSGRRSGSASMSTATGSPSASASSARMRPCSPRIAGCRPRAISRSSRRPVSSSRAASSSSVGRRLRVRGQPRPGEAQLEHDRDEALLRAVVEVALEPAALVVAGPDQARARGDQVGAGLSAGDGERGQLAEGDEPVLGVGGQRVLAGDRDGAPERAGHDDRHGRGRAIADAEDRVGHLAGEPAPVVHTRRRSRLQHARDRRVRLGRQPLADAEDVDAVAVVAPDDGGRVVALVAHDDRGVDVQDPRALLGHRHEDALGADLRGDERGHAPQRALLGGQPADLRELGPGVAFQRVVVLARLAVGEVDPGGDERLGHAVGPAIGLFDHAMRRRPPSLLSQWPTCGAGVPVVQTYSRNSPKASRSSGGMTKSRASRPISSWRRKPVARSHASLKSRIRPSRSRTQTSDCVASVRVRAKDSPTGNSAGWLGSSIVGPLRVAAPLARSQVCRAN